MKGRTRSLWRDTNAAVAPTVGLSLFVLIGAGGIAFDYARMATLDTELQNAADQAALAAASQLDGRAGACARAAAAAAALIQNETRFSNDGAGLNIAVATTGESACDATGAVRFYQSYNNTTDAYGAASDADDNANVVEINVTARRLDFALTPLVGSFGSGDINASATASLQSAVCKVPPLMMCNPDETSTNLDFNVANYIGKGLRLVQGGSTGGAWKPGNFGYLETGLGPGANVLEYALGANTPPGPCFGLSGVTTKTGLQTSVTDAINTRFDIYENGLTNSCAESTGNCSPGINARKDVVHTAFPTTPSTGNGNSGPNCGLETGNDPWQKPVRPYLPDPTTRTMATNPSSMGHPRDICHAISVDGDCGTTEISRRFGDGNWDRDMYFEVNHAALTAAQTGGDWKLIPSLRTFVTNSGAADADGINGTSALELASYLPNISRYQIYLWEASDATLRASYQTSTGGGPGNSGGPLYNFAEPKCAAGLAPTATRLDRRVTAVAVINCEAQGVNGKEKGVPVEKWVEVFIVQPSLNRDRTAASDLYVEPIREVDAGGNDVQSAQVIRRDTPLLLR
ncbi:pilus assembly protein TadG-related protein [Sphingomicrobium sediminis]|uniref:Pilus assembly protein TadG-related protein n=1 Tax=Sphingomicrobium sediminis TaxID=2950949 RepID=A0A9X2J266_9SPHN|nr:pilus assembly protein TadG-related protein [Sphingomicrobium sediminis]MCM8557963.1 pilus assembly protein TadG-related protein [Sphingomicrobium sediminis]